MNKNRLPWYCKGYKNPDDFKEMLQARYERCMIKEIINWAPPKIKNCLVKILKLNFKDKPPYDELLTTLEDCFINEIIDEEEKYD